MRTTRWLAGALSALTLSLAACDQPVGPAADRAPEVALLAAKTGGRVVDAPVPLYAWAVWTPDGARVALFWVRRSSCTDGNTELFNPTLDAYTCTPMEIEGFAVYEKGLDPLYSTPHQANFHNAGPMEVWFVPGSVFFPALFNDGMVYRSEIESAAIKGTATSFHWVFHPAADPGTEGGSRITHVTANSEGTLEPNSQGYTSFKVRADFTFLPAWAATDRFFGGTDRIELR